jgi:hypothetical protein
MRPGKKPRINFFRADRKEKRDRRRNPIIAINPMAYSEVINFGFRLFAAPTNTSQIGDGRLCDVIASLDAALHKTNNHFSLTKVHIDSSAIPKGQHIRSIYAHAFCRYGLLKCIRFRAAFFAGRVAPETLSRDLRRGAKRFLRYRSAAMKTASFSKPEFAIALK